MRVLVCICMDLCVAVHSGCEKKEQRVTGSPLSVFYWWDFSAVVLPGKFKIDYRNSWGGLFSLNATYLALTSRFLATMHKNIISRNTETFTNILDVPIWLIWLSDRMCFLPRCTCYSDHIWFLLCLISLMSSITAHPTFVTVSTTCSRSPLSREGSIK